MIIGKTESLMDNIQGQIRYLQLTKGYTEEIEIQDFFSSEAWGCWALCSAPFSLSSSSLSSS